MQKKFIKPILALSILLVVILGMYLTYQYFKPETTKGSKKIVIEVVNKDEKKEFTLYTEEEYLRAPLESEGEFGLYVQEVNGYKADESKQEWWCITKSGETLNTGVDTTPINDNDHFEITLTVGY